MVVRVPRRVPNPVSGVDNPVKSPSLFLVRSPAPLSFPQVRTDRVLGNFVAVLHRLSER